jgi:hypothetical protein
MLLKLAACLFVTVLLNNGSLLSWNSLMSSNMSLCLFVSIPPTKMSAFVSSLNFSYLSVPIEYL